MFDVFFIFFFPLYVSRGEARLRIINPLLDLLDWDNYLMTRETMLVSEKKRNAIDIFFSRKNSYSSRGLIILGLISRNPCSQQFEQQLDNSGGGGRGLAGKSQRRQLLARLFARGISYDSWNDPL